VVGLGVAASTAAAIVVVEGVVERLINVLVWIGGGLLRGVYTLRVLTDGLEGTFGNDKLLCT